MSSTSFSKAVPDGLEPEVLLMGTCRELRIRRVGRTFLIENLHLVRTLDASGQEHVDEHWKVVAVSKPDGKGKSAWQAACEWMGEANARIVEEHRQDMRRRASAAARGAD